MMGLVLVVPKKRKKLGESMTDVKVRLAEFVD